MAKSDVTHVGIGKYERRPRGEFLRAQGISAGVGVALSNVKNGTGRLGFFTMSSLGAFHSMIGNALMGTEGPRSAGGRPQEVRAWYVGCAFVAPREEGAGELNAEASQLRGQVTRLLDDAGFRIVRGFWLKVGQAATMTLECGTEQCSIRVGSDRASS